MGAALLADPRGVVATQGHRLTTAAFAATLVLEATVHHLDMVAELPEAPPPGPLSFAAAVMALDGLTGGRLSTWDDERYVLVATGREPLSTADRAALGARADAFPALG
jgi:hypothetical protein